MHDGVYLFSIDPELGRAEVGIREPRKMEEEARELGRAEVGIRELRKMEVEPR